MATGKPSFRFFEVIGCNVGSNNDYAPQVQRAATALVYDLQLIHRDASPEQLRQKIRDATNTSGDAWVGLEKLAAEFVRARADGGSKALVGSGYDGRAELEAGLGPAVTLLATLLDRVEGDALEAARKERSAWIEAEAKKS